MSRVAQLKMYGTKGVPPASSHTKKTKNLLEIDGFHWFWLVFVGKVNKLKRTNLLDTMVNDRHHGSSSDIWTPLNVLKAGVIIDLGFLGNIE